MSKWWLLLLWKKDVGVSLRFKTNNYIDFNIGRGLENSWRSLVCTGNHVGRTNI